MVFFFLIKVNYLSKNNIKITFMHAHTDMYAHACGHTQRNAM